MRRLFLEMGFNNRDKQIKYGCEFLFISRIYSRLIQDVNIPDLRKISITIIDDPERVRIVPTDNFIQVCEIYKYIILDKLVNEQQEAERNKIILNILQECVMELVQKFSWPENGFINAYNKVLETGFKNEFILIPAKTSKDRRLSASIVINGTKECISIILELNDKKHENEHRKIELIKVGFYLDVFSDIVHKLKWMNNNEVIISNKAEEINFRYQIQDKQAEIFLTPKVHNEAFLLNELKLLNPEISRKYFSDILKKQIDSIKKL